jgi:hypothetical protein
VSVMRETNRVREWVSECDERNKQGERVSKRARSHRENHRKKRDKGKTEWDNEAKREDENDHDGNDDDDEDEMYVVSGGSHCMILSSLVRTWFYLPYRTKSALLHARRVSNGCVPVLHY